MEMESSRRPPFDRSRELVSKKPRLSDESNLSGRQFQQPPVQRPAIANRFREKEPEDSVRGSLQQQQQQQQQHQELVNQYKTALAELTFNSKPIITNLTIIAGENLQAAKAIAATICSNIIEVPSEQKLPSLYLLDSIVKNIGRDYIKCFAAKLPEVFCKAYRQVDPSIHNGMRHLFGTWKGVFPAQALQLIEKELGFSTAVNGSSSGTTISKSDSQSQRQPHSIHVNPKYLEARQRLQQSSKMKGTDIGVADVGSVEDERTERTAGVGSERPWIDPSMKNVRPQREALRESCLQKQGGGAYGDFEFAPGLSRPLGTSGAKPSERVIGQKWIGSGREVEDSISSERNGYDVKRGIPKYSAGRPAISSIPSVPNKPRISAEISRSWKNSEEEEYMWDDLGTKGTDSSATAVLKKEIWSEDPEKVELGSRLLKWQSQTDVRSSFERELLADSLSCEQKEQVPFGHPRSSHWKTQELNQADSSNPLLQQVVTHPVIGATLGGVPSLGFPTTSVTASVGPMGRHPSPGRSAINQRPPSPSLSKRDPRQNLIDKDHMRSYPLVRADPRSVSSSGQLNTGVRDKHIQDSMPQLQNPKVQKLQPSTLLKPPSPTTFHPKHHVPSSEQLSNSKTELSDIVQKAQQLLGSSLTKDTSSESVNPVAGNMQGQSNVSSLLAAVMKSGLLSGNSVSGQVGTHPSATTISSPSIKMSSKDATTSSAPCDSSATVVSLGKLEKPPLVPRVSSSPMNTSAATPSAAAAKSNPLSILSTLISKGLISAPKSESAASVPVKSEDQLQGQSPTVATVTTDTGLAVSKVSANLFDSSTENVSSVDTAVKRSDLVQSTKEEVEDLIGFEFRPRLLRDLHPAVIDKLCDNLPHRCTTCGLRFKLQERLARHSEWHAFKNSIPKCLNKPIRRWYSRSSDWIAGKAGFPFGYNSAYLTEGSNRIREDKEKIVPADESQCVCLLCGELFEDFYSQERDEWMFRGAVYLSTSSGSTEGGSCSDSSLQNLIVHANCMSGDSGRDLGLIRGIKVEKGP